MSTNFLLRKEPEVRIDGMNPIPSGVASGDNKMVVYMGTTPNIGTTVVSFGSAVCAARASRLNVGYLCLNLKSSKLHRYMGMNEVLSSLDQLRADLKSQSLTRQRLLRHCIQAPGLPGLSVLFGSSLREQAEFYQPEDIEHLLTAARSAFDLCIVEVNAYWDNAATVAALLEADARVVVTTPDLTHFQEDFQRWLQTMAPMFGLHSASFHLVVNQVEKMASAGGIRVKDIEKETGLKIVSQVPRKSNLVELLNQGKLMELFEGDHPFYLAVADITRMFMDQWNMEAMDISRKKRWLGRWIPRAIS
ncbi:hypothetical protein [Paenibacillus sp. J2TS4]|uniref:AAA family ATPase n=1 Tax=Paenibacillus sp. J2TS4 TaxID=2807194 RepID=UPI001B13D2A2|nr:hypothetical protein [Paenibacillus sp. J2TS4]GIP35434.1 hypothetical protein J2TS4_46440 [Paenibacillus sp. J2TS4]